MPAQWNRKPRAHGVAELAIGPSTQNISVSNFCPAFRCCSASHTRSVLLIYLSLYFSFSLFLFLFFGFSSCVPSSPQFTPFSEFFSFAMLFYHFSHRRMYRKNGGTPSQKNGINCDAIIWCLFHSPVVSDWNNQFRTERKMCRTYTHHPTRPSLYSVAGCAFTCLPSQRLPLSYWHCDNQVTTHTAVVLCVICIHAIS